MWSTIDMVEAMVYVVNMSTINMVIINLNKLGQWSTMVLELYISNHFKYRVPIFFYQIYTKLIKRIYP
jgi:hypothetical protein